VPAEELPEVTQVFEADATRYVAGVEAMIAAAEAFTRANEAALVSVEALHAAIDALPVLHETVIRVRYETEGVPTDVAAAMTAAATARTTTVPGGAEGGTVIVPPVPAEEAGTAAAVIDEVAAAEARAAAAARAQAESAAAAAAAARALTAEDLAQAAAATAAAGAERDLSAAVAETAAAQDAAAAAARFAAAEGAGGAGGGAAAAAAGAAAGAAGGRRIFGLSANAIHWIISGTAEYLAVAIPGAVAAAAGALVMYQGVVERTGVRMQALRTVTEALGPAFGKTAGDILGTGHALQAAQDAANPIAWSLLGNMIDIARAHLGNFAQMGTQVAQVFQRFAAEVTVDMTGAFGHQLEGLLSKAVSDFVEFGQILGNVGHAVLNFASAMPGLAELLLKIADAISRVILWVSEIPAPFITAAMAFEEFIRWGGLLTRGIGALLLGLGKLLPEGSAAAEAMTSAGNAAKAASTGFWTFARSLVVFLATSPAGWALDAVVAIGVFTYAVVTAKDQTQQWVASVNQMLAKAPDISVINTTAQALTATNRQLAQAQEVLSTKTSAWAAITSGVSQDVSALQTEHQHLITTLGTEASDVGYISSTYKVSFAAAVAIAAASGVKLTQTLHGNSHAAQVARQQIAALVTGYTQIGQVGGALGASMNAVSLQTSLQNTQVSKLNSAWDAYFQTLTGGTSALAGFYSDLEQMGNISTTTGSKISAFSGSTQLSVSQIAHALTSFSGQSAQVWQSFDQSVTQAGTTSDWLRTAMAAGVLSAGQYTEAIKGLVAQLIPYASQSQAAQGELIGIAQQVDPNITNFQQLTTWVGNTTTATHGLNQAVATATTKLGGLNSVAATFTGTLQTDVIGATAQAVTRQAGFEAQLGRVINAFRSGGPHSRAFTQNLSALDTTLQHLGFTHQQVTSYNGALISSMSGVTQATHHHAAAVQTLGASYQNNLHWETTGTHLSRFPQVAANDWRVLTVTVQRYAEAMARSVTQYAGDIGRTFTTVWDDVSKTAQSVFTGVRRTIITPIAGAFTDVKNTIVSGFDSWWRTHGKELEQLWRVTWDTITSIFRGIGGVLSKDARIFWDGLTADARTAWGALEPIVRAGWDVVEGVFRAGWAVLRAVWAAGWDAIKGAAQVVWDAIEAALKIGWDTLVALFSVALDLLTGHWHQAWEDIKTWGEQVWNNIAGFFTNAWHTFASTAASIWHIIGTDLVDGLKNGIMQAASGIANFVRTYLVDPIVNAVKHFFGIASPSTVMAGLGENLIHGLVQGLSHDAHTLVGKIFGSWPQALAAVIGKGLINLAELPASMLGKIGNVLGAVGSGLAKLLGIGGGGNAGAVALGKQMAAAYGWTGSQWQALYSLWMRESGWNPYAVNPSSGAAGIAQSLGHGPVPLGNAAAQISWGLSYILQRYGSPSAAWAHEVAYGWYDQGGWLQPGLTLAYNGTGRPEPVGAAASPVVEVHLHGDLADQRIWDRLQAQTYQFNTRNGGRRTGAWIPA